VGAGAALRLYLSSFRLGNQPRKLVDLVAAGPRRAGGSTAQPRALVIANTCDTFEEAERRPRVERELAALRGLGFSADELDLRNYFDPSKRGSLAAQLAAADLVWARGGNSFVYRRAMRRSGFDDLIADALARDALVYGGYSGGIAVLAPSLQGIEIVNDPAAAPAPYDSDPAPIWECLGLIPYYVAPHYKSAHFASPGMDKVIQYFIDHHMPFKALRDGEAILIEGGREEILA
jgi:dipeptidase E